jgi:hypothetical protein
MSETFHLGDILSITDGHLVSPDHMDGVHRIIDYMTGVPHFTHQLPRGAEACKPHLLAQHPWLADIVAPDEFRDTAHVESWLAEMVGIYGERHTVSPIRPGSYNARDPLAELIEMVGPERVITVELPHAARGKD